LSRLNASLRQFRKGLIDYAEAQLDTKGTKLIREEIAALKSHDIVLITEFFYVLWAVGDVTSERLEAYLEKHNADMRALIETDEKGRTRSGIATEQIRKSLLSPTQIRRVLHESSHGQVVFDQYTLQKLLRERLSFETSRTRLLLLGRTGLLRRHDVGNILYGSSGVLENLFHSHLLRLKELFR
jgi:transcriptional regulator with AAA-type ATPase domain